MRGETNRVVGAVTGNSGREMGGKCPTVQFGALVTNFSIAQTLGNLRSGKGAFGQAIHRY